MKSRKNTAGTIIRVLIILVLAVLIGGVLLFNFFFKTDGTPSSIFGIYFLRTNEVYMENEIMPGDMIIAVKTDPAELAADDVVICQFRDRITIMRIMAVGEGEPLTFSVKYDTVPETDAFSIGADNIIARARYKDAVMGKLLDVATSVPGIIVAVIIPLTLIIIYQITRFAGGREDTDDEESDDGEGIIRERSTKSVSERTADLTEMLSERELDDPAISLTHFKSTAPEDEAYTRTPAERKLAIDERGKAVVQQNTERADLYKQPAASPTVSRRAEFEATRQIALNAYTKNTPEANGVSANVREDIRTVKTPGGVSESVRLVKTPGGAGENVRNSGGEAVRASDPVVFLKPEPVKSAPNVTRIGDLVRDTAREDAREKLLPKPASVIPESITRLQQTASQTAPSGFDDSVREYYRKEDDTPSQRFAEPAAYIPPLSTPVIPEGAAIPKENLAPVRRKKSTHTIDELMKIIDSEAGKITK
jgi:hypothetical protein